MTQRQLIITVMGQTGDIMHVAGALALYPEVDVLLLYQNSTAEPVALLKFFEGAANKHNPSAGIKRVNSYCPPTQTIQFDAARVLYNQLKSTPALDWINKKNSKKYGDIRKVVLDIEKFIKSRLRYGPDDSKSTYLTISVGDTTTLIAKHFELAEDKAKDKAVIYEEIVNALADDPGRLPEEIVRKMETKEFGTLPKPDPSKPPIPILLLWARYSGQNSPEGYNPEGDSDVVGQEQLLDLAIKQGYQVVTIGHGPETGKAVEAKYHLGDFYNKSILIGKGRGAQVSFFLALMQRYPGGIVQMGQKSGGMDGAALVGIPTLYIEDSESPSLPRMRQWTEPLAVPFYRRALPRDPPTSLGKAMRQVDKALPEMTEEFQKDFRYKNRRMIAWVYTLQHELNTLQESKGVGNAVTIGKAGGKTSLEVVTRLVSDASEEQLKAWMRQIKELEVNDEKLAPEKKKFALCGITRGYTDVDVIGKALESLTEELRNKPFLIRNKEGKYVVGTAVSPTPLNKGA